MCSVDTLRADFYTKTSQWIPSPTLQASDREGQCHYAHLPLHSVFSNGSTCLKLFQAEFQRYVFLVSGYDNDQKELYQIPEVVRFIKDLNSKLPFWLYFINTSDKKFFSWMIACLCQAMSLDQDEETIYADFDADAYNDLIEYQFRNIVKLMSGLGMRESIQEKVLKALSANLASLMVVEN